MWLLRTHRCELPTPFNVQDTQAGIGSIWRCTTEIKTENNTKEICNRTWELREYHHWQEVDPGEL